MNDLDLKCRRKSGKRPKIWMLKSVRLNTEVVVGRREASTVDAINAAFVERLEGYVFCGGRVAVLSGVLRDANGTVADAELTVVSGGRDEAVVEKEA